MRTKVIASTVGLLTLGAFASPGTANADYSVCNKSSVNVYVAVAYVDPGGLGFVSKGWRKLIAGNCQMLVGDGETSDPHNYFVYAVEVGGGREWTGSDGFCTTAKAFKIVGNQNGSFCADHGYNEHGFFHVESPTDNHTTNLRDSSGGQILDEG
jgi:uncharacterized membrane protein